MESVSELFLVLRDNLHIIKTPVPSECITVLYQLKLLYLISWFNYELVNWKIHGTSSEGQNTQKFKEDWSICFTWAVTCSAELQKSALIQSGKLILGLNNWITKQEDNSLPFMRCECIYCQPWLVCDWFICMLWFPKDPSSNYSCRNAFSAVLSTPSALSGTCPCLCKCWIDWPADCGSPWMGDTCRGQQELQIPTSGSLCFIPAWKAFSEVAEVRQNIWSIIWK